VARYGVARYLPDAALGGNKGQRGMPTVAPVCGSPDRFSQGIVTHLPGVLAGEVFKKQ
jgi:hypothetical protein